MKQGNVTILGSYVVDLMARVPHLPVSGETVRGSMFKFGPGGKGSNQAVAAHRAGASVRFITRLGDDIFGEAALRFYRQEGVDLTHVYKSASDPTGAALIMVDDRTGSNKIAVVPGACDSITAAEVESARPAIEQADVFLTQLETNIDAVERAVAIAAAAGVSVILNPAPAGEVSDAILSRVDIITPNETEAAILSGVDVDCEESALRSARALLKRGAKTAIITLGEKGSLIVTAGDFHRIAPLKVQAVDSTGAGDAFNGALATALSEGMPLERAAAFASVAAGLSVTRVGTAPAMPRREEIDGALNRF